MKENYYLVIIIDDVEPEIHGPYDTPEDRDAAALEFREAEGPEHGIYPLTITGEIEAVEVNTYSGGFFEEEE